MARGASSPPDLPRPEKLLAQRNTVASKRSVLTKGEIEARLNACLDVEFSFCNTAVPAADLVSLSRDDQEYILTWVERVASTNIDLAYRFSCQGKRVLDETDRSVIDEWAMLVMDTYDRAGLRRAIDVMESLDRFVDDNHARGNGKHLRDCESVLSGFIHGLSGRRLQIKSDSNVYTDTETLFLPEMQSRLASSEDNFLYYKIQSAMLWAQTRYGSLRRSIVDALIERDSEELNALFNAFEVCRLESRIAAELPGLHREIQRLTRELALKREGPVWERVEPLLTNPQADSTLSLTLADECLKNGERVDIPWMGDLQIEAVDQCLRRRMEEEKALLAAALNQVSAERAQENSPGQNKPVFHARIDPANSDEPEVEILLGDKPVELSESTQSVLRSILLDIGHVPDDYLDPTGSGEYDPDQSSGNTRDSADSNVGDRQVDPGIFYPEWDFRRQHYRKNWCTVREKSVEPTRNSFVDDTLHKYRGLLKHLRKTFEAMRDSDALLKRQADGDDVDIDALVAALADARDGAEMDERVFTRMHRSERNIAVLFMVDMSGSTKGWINEAERESLVLLCESLETLGDRYAIYGFSSVTRKRCEIYHIKHFDEHYSDTVKGRISGIEPQDYTRMGFAIRHLTNLLKSVDARTHVLITLSDGKPDDYDHYRGEFGIEDTRRALLEARREGIHPYCITIDEKAQDYLPKLYGSAAYTVVSNVRELPLKVSDIYRRLTS